MIDTQTESKIKPTERRVKKALESEFPGFNFAVTMPGKGKIVKVEYAHGPAKNKVRKVMEKFEGDYHVAIYRSIDLEIFEQMVESVKIEFQDIDDSSARCKAIEIFDSVDMTTEPGEEVNIT